MTEKINLAIDALAAAAFIEGGVSPEKCQAARDLTDQRKRELVAVISAPCLHQIQEPASVQAVQPVICDTCNDHGMIGGPSFYDPGEGGQPCPDCEERHRNSLAAGDLMAWAAEVGGNRIAENVVEMTREDLQRLIAERTPQTAPAAVAVADELAEPTTWMLVEDLVQAECAKNRLHQEYMGKAMPEDVYQRFERLRDERVPALRAQVYARLAATPAPDAQVPQGSYVSTSGELKPDVSVYSTPAAAPVMLPEPDAEIAVLMNRSACQKYPNDINLRIAHNEGWNAARALLATATGLPAQQVEMPDFDLRTSKGGRGFVAWFFANVLQRYDYENYITNKLAADFACDLAKALSSTLAAPQAQADARDAEQERWMGIGKAIERACVDLPAGAEINIHLEKDAGTVTLSDCDGDEQENFPTDEGFAGVVNAAIDAAIAAAKGE